jgi:uncharacterized RDD family membrane protein YckC
MTAVHATPSPGDNRAFITQDALHVAPELIGLPLAGPWRRGAAFAVDGLLVAILANAPGALLGFAGALVLFRASARGATSAGYFRRSARVGFRIAGALLLFLMVLKGWGSIADRVETRVIPDVAAEDDSATESGASVAASDVEGAPALTMSGPEGLRLAAEVYAFRRSSSEQQARERAESLVLALREHGTEEDDIRETLSGLSDGAADKPWLRAATDSVASHLGDAEGEAEVADPPPAPDSLALAYAAALRDDRTDRADSLRPAMTQAFAGDSLAAMSASVRKLSRERDQLESRLESARREHSDSGFVARASTLIQEDLGLGLGWMGLYFTATLALWQGRTPGKRLFGIRVVRLNGKPIGWWAAFERFGGYAAGVATGLLGFAQIFWDKNRQATHDNICETAVIRD